MVDEIILRFSVKDDGSPVIEKVNTKLGETKKQSQALVPGLENARQSMTGFISQNAALIGVLAGVGAALGKIIKDHIEYANAVRQQAQISGTSTEAASRYLQVLDDYKISSDEALQATRALTNAGHVPSIETLAKLSDQYLKLNSDQEKNEFILKNLGRGGLQWVEVLQKGGDALRKQGDAVADNLILSQKMVDDARRAELAVDEFNDALGGVKTTLAVGLLPVMSDFMIGLMHQGELWKERARLMKEGMSLTDANAQALENVKNSLYNVDSASEAAAGGLSDLNEKQKESKEAAEAAEAAAKRLSDVYSGMLSSMFSIQDAMDSYADTVADLSKEHDDLLKQKQNLIYEHQMEAGTTKQTVENYSEYIKKLYDVNQAIAENEQKTKDAAEGNKQAADQRVYDLLQQKLAADGLVSTKEFEYLQKTAVSLGLVSKAASDQAISENKRADAMAASFELTLPPMERTLSIMEAISSYNGAVVQFGVNFSSNAAMPYNVPGAVSQPGGTGAGGSGAGNRRDSGGWGMAGESYLIGTGAQPEMFTPSTNGIFTPANKIGATNNFVINIGSIRSQADLDYLAQEITRRQAAV